MKLFTFSKDIFENRVSFALFFYLLFAYIGLTPFSSENLVFEIDNTGGGNLLRQIIFIFLFLFSAFYFVVCKKLTNKLFNIRLYPFYLLLIWCLLSVFWSDVQAIALRRSILLVLNSLTLLFLVLMLSYKQIIEVLSKLFVFLLLVSYIGIFTLDGAIHNAPELFDSGLEGNWKGIFPHKNDAAPAVVFGVFIFIFKYYKEKSFYWLFLILLSVLFLYFTKSKTTLALLLPSIFFGLFSSIFFKRPNMKAIYSVTVTFFILLLFMISPYLWFEFTYILNDPEAFTGRSTIWDIIISAISDNLIIGIGYGSTWHVGNESILPMYSFGFVDWVYTITQGHNGYLDLTLSLGIVGLILFLLSFYILPLYLNNTLVTEDSNFCFLFFSLLFFTFFHGMLETNFLVIDKGYWAVYYIIFASNLSNGIKDKC